jgi:hypothetical protein
MFMLLSDLNGLVPDAWPVPLVDKNLKYNRCFVQNYAMLDLSTHAAFQLGDRKAKLSHRNSNDSLLQPKLDINFAN